MGSPELNDKEMTIEGADHFEFGFDHCDEVCFEHYPEFEMDEMLSDLFSLNRVCFGSLSLMKWKECEEI